MTIGCPLCKSADTTLREVVLGRDLNALYVQHVGIPDAVQTATLEYRECGNCALKFFWPLEAGREAFYEKLQAFDWYYGEKKEEFQIALTLLESAGKILEVGAGKGVFGMMVGSGRYTGLEFNGKAIERAKAMGISLLKESIEDHAKRMPHTYDAVVSFQVLEHVESPAAFLSACVECLKPGGVMIISVPSQDGFIAQAINHVLDMPPHHLTHWSEVTLRKVGDIFNLSLILLEHEKIATYHGRSIRKIRIENWIRMHLGFKFRLVDRRFAARALSRIAGFLARFALPLPTGIKGHTVVAGYRKL